MVLIVTGSPVSAAAGVAVISVLALIFSSGAGDGRFRDGPLRPRYSRMTGSSTV